MIKQLLTGVLVFLKDEIDQHANPIGIARISVGIQNLKRHMKASENSGTQKNLICSLKYLATVRDPTVSHQGSVCAGVRPELGNSERRAKSASHIMTKLIWWAMVISIPNSLPVPLQRC